MTTQPMPKDFTFQPIGRVGSSSAFQTVSKPYQFKAPIPIGSGVSAMKTTLNFTEKFHRPTLDISGRHSIEKTVNHYKLTTQESGKSSKSSMEFKKVENGVTTERNRFLWENPMKIAKHKKGSTTITEAGDRVEQKRPSPKISELMSSYEKDRNVNKQSATFSSARTELKYGDENIAVEANKDAKTTIDQLTTKLSQIRMNEENSYDSKDWEIFFWKERLTVKTLAEWIRNRKNERQNAGKRVDQNLYKLSGTKQELIHRTITIHIQENLKHMKNTKLMELLFFLGLKKSGNKVDLIRRLVEAGPTYWILEETSV